MNILCTDINGYIHIVSEVDIVQRKSVYGLIERPDGVILVRDRTRVDNKWDIPGGGVDTGEDIITALQREIKEETGLEIISDPQKICEFIEYFYDVDTQAGWRSTRCFYKITTSGTLRLDGNDDDILEVRRFESPLSSQEITPVAREIIAMAIRP